MAISCVFYVYSFVCHKKKQVCLNVRNPVVRTRYITCLCVSRIASVKSTYYAAVTKPRHIHHHHHPSDKAHPKPSKHDE